MYEKQENQILMPDNFFLPFEGKLNKENRWVIKAVLFPSGGPKRNMPIGSNL